MSFVVHVLPTYFIPSESVVGNGNGVRYTQSVEVGSLFFQFNNTRARFPSNFLEL
jgi:hypothetical protein